MDVKYVSTTCCEGKDGQKFYQYTILEEATRERFIYPYMKQSSYSTMDFVKITITYFGYAPDEMETDNGAEFTCLSKAKRTYMFDKFCNKYNIKHHLIRPGTLWHNGKVKRVATEIIRNTFTIILDFIYIQTF